MGSQLVTAILVSWTALTPPEVLCRGSGRVGKTVAAAKHLTPVALEAMALFIHLRAQRKVLHYRQPDIRPEDCHQANFVGPFFDRWSGSRPLRRFPGRI